MKRSSAIMLVLFAICMTALGLSVLSIALEEGDPLAGVAILCALFLLPGVVAVGCAFRVKIEADDRGVRVVNIFSDRRVPWSEIVTAEAGYYGVTIGLTDARTVTAMAAQKSNLASWTGRRTRADEIADFINGRCSGAHRLLR